MGRKKRYRGHYCRICGLILPNEKFSGRGHVIHICKKCVKKPRERQDEETALNRIGRVYRYGNLSRNNRRMLEDYARSPSERIRAAAAEAIASFTRRFLADDFDDDEYPACYRIPDDRELEDDEVPWDDREYPESDEIPF
ncbi:MAG: hypothetical protein M0Z41_18405 [Peptococcaceae bacterium]|jgi:hypothetical protein|nr:hypothetical protein [Peptococcaceae bacterium]